MTNSFRSAQFAGSEQGSRKRGTVFLAQDNKFFYSGNQNRHKSGAELNRRDKIRAQADVHPVANNKRII